MLKPEQNQALMEVGPGTLMGDLLRRYWTPFAAAGEMDATPVKAGATDGRRPGALQGRERQLRTRRPPLPAPPRGHVLRLGRGVRHPLQLPRLEVRPRPAPCIDQPFEEIAHPDARFKERITIKAYPVEERAGLLWAYMGPQPAPEVPVWEPFTWGNGFVQIVLSEIPCNWFQCQENSIDPVHFEWLHDNWGQRLRGQTNGKKPPTPPAGCVRRIRVRLHLPRIREGQSEQDELWTVGRTCLWPNCLFTGNHFEWRVPIDDDNTLSVGWFFDRVPEEMEPFRQQRIPYW